MVKRIFILIFIVTLSFIIMEKDSNSILLPLYSKERSEVQVTILPDVGKKTNPIKLVFNGKHYGKDGVSLLREERKSKDGNDELDKDEMFKYLKNMYGILKDGEADKYIELWDEKYRKEAKEYFDSDPRAWEIKRIKSHEVHRLISTTLYGDYVIIQILSIYHKESVYLTTITLLSKEGKFWLTKDIDEDYLLAYFEGANAHTFVEEYKKKLEKEKKIRRGEYGVH